MTKFRCIFILFYLSSTSLHASIEDSITEINEHTQNTVTVNKKIKGTWLPVPIPISNPTIGSGLQAALLYLHPKTSSDLTVPNSTSGIMAMYTDTKSRLLGAFHDGNWKNDLYRFRIVAGTGTFNLDYFGIGDDSDLKNNPIPYAIDTDILFSQLLRQIPSNKDWYLGLRYAFIRSNVAFEALSNPDLPAINTNAITSSLGIITNYDSRDNNYYPLHGNLFELSWSITDEALGSDFNFSNLNISLNHYQSFSTKSVVAFRIKVSDTNGNVPFYLLPTLRLRGFPAGRYKNNSLISGHTEWRYKPVQRWGYILFFEAGSVADTFSTLPDNELITAYGAGIRWQVTQDKRLNLGLDIGFSKGESAVYVNIGERF